MMRKSKKLILKLQLICLLNKGKHSKGKSALIFKVKDKVVGKKKVGQEATVLMYPKSSDEVTTPAGIKQVSIDCCQDLLTNREPKEEFKEDLLLKQIIHLIQI
jgi:hypothetical protein